MPSVGTLGVVALLFFTIFDIVGMQLFAGKLGACLGIPRAHGGSGHVARADLFDLALDLVLDDLLQLVRGLGALVVVLLGLRVYLRDELAERLAAAERMVAAVGA